MNRFQRSWQLFKSSLAVMGRDKKLLLFPIVITLCTLFVAGLFLVPVALQPTGHSYLSGQHWQAIADRASQHTATTTPEADGTTTRSTMHRPAKVDFRPVALAYFALMYFTSMFVATFLNVAFYSQILRALRGEAVSITGGLGFAASRWRSILAWSLFAGVVGFLIKTLEQRFGFLGQLIMRLIGAAWSVACVFVVPVIITEERTFNPLKILQQSAVTLTRTWGESLIGYVGVAFGNTLVLFLSLAWLAGGIAACVALKFYWGIAGIVGIWLLVIVIWSYLLSVASQIFRCALFLYATHGSLPAPYTAEMMALAWKEKK